MREYFKWNGLADNKPKKPPKWFLHSLFQWTCKQISTVNAMISCSIFLSNQLIQAANYFGLLLWNSSSSISRGWLFGSRPHGTRESSHFVNAVSVLFCPSLFPTSQMNLFTSWSCFGLKYYFFCQSSSNLSTLFLSLYVPSTLSLPYLSSNLHFSALPGASGRDKQETFFHTGEGDVKEQVLFRQTTRQPTKAFHQRDPRCGRFMRLRLNV